MTKKRSSTNKKFRLTRGGDGRQSLDKKEKKKMLKKRGGTKKERTSSIFIGTHIRNCLNSCNNARSYIRSLKFSSVLDLLPFSLFVFPVPSYLLDGV